MGRKSLLDLLWTSIGFSVIFTVSFTHGYTYEQDVYAINSLYIALGSPPLPGWIDIGGDPCMDAWQGVLCVASNITSITLNGANLGGELGDLLGNFSSLITMDLSNNHIGGTIPESLPVTVRQFFLSGNLFTGSIPISLSEMTLLSDISLKDNLLTGELPDVFEGLTGLINLDLSSNSLSGPLPPSMESLSSLITLHVQDNKLSGTLDVLQDLPLQDLDIENNLFSGPIPVKLLNIPNFKKDGNPFNTTILPSPTLPPSPLPLPGAPVPAPMPANPLEGPVNGYGPVQKSKKVSIAKIVGFVVAGLCIIVIGLLLIVFCISKSQKRKLKLPHRDKGQDQDFMAQVGPQVHHTWTDLNKPLKQLERVPKESAQKQQEHKIDNMGSGTVLIPPPSKEVVVDHKVNSKKIPRNPVKNIMEPISTTGFSVAALQQYTNSFSEENLIKQSRVGQVYLGELPQGKLLAIMKFNNGNSSMSSNEFVELASSISKIQHPNIVQLVGYCSEFGQRLLLYNYFSKMTLQDALHYENKFKKKLSWNARIQVALEAAKALEYLHVGCHPPIVHQNFEPSNILISDDLAVQVSECGLASALSSCLTQLSGDPSSYQAPEVSESGSYSEASDVYSFGVVMLELLTGRKLYDNSLPRGERHLVQWASSQLHDIDALMRMVDPSMQGLYSVKSLSRFADIISRCIQQTPEFRPPISDVVQDLCLCHG